MQTGSIVTQATPGKPDVDESSYTGRPITKHPDWGKATALDIWFNNLSIGTFLVAVFAVLLAPVNFVGLATYAFPLALVFLVIDLLLLVSDLGDPLRFHHMLRVLKPSSPMSFGTWSLSGYGVLLGLASAIAVLNWPIFTGWQATLIQMGVWNIIEWLGVAAAILAIIPAIGGILYKGVLFSVTSQPGWKDARWLGGYIANSAILMGSSVVLLLALWMGESAAITMLRFSLVILLVFDTVLLGLFYRNIHSTFILRFNHRQRILAWAVILGFGILAPFVILLVGTPLILVPILVILTALVPRFILVNL